MRCFTESVGPNGASLTAYLHDDSPELSNAAVRPAVLVCPGGGYKRCSDREAEPVALAYLAEGYHAFALRYTVGPDAVFDRALEDAACALERVRAMAGAWRVRPDKVAALGFSAGGHLAAALGVRARTKPNALLLGYAVTLETRLGGKDYPSIVPYVDAHTPPTFLFATREDEIVPVRHTLAFANALERAGVAFEAHVFQKGRHGLALAKPHTCNAHAYGVDDAFAGWFNLSTAWLKGVWGDFPLDGPRHG